MIFPVSADNGSLIDLQSNAGQHYQKYCSICHAKGIAGAPKIFDEMAWAKRLKTASYTDLLQSVKRGKGIMPPRGGAQSLTDAELLEAIVFLVTAHEEKPCLEENIE